MDLDSEQLEPARNNQEQSETCAEGFRSEFVRHAPAFSGVDIANPFVLFFLWFDRRGSGCFRLCTTHSIIIYVVNASALLRGTRLHSRGGMKAKAGTPSRNMRECIIDITSAFRGVHAAHKQVDVVVTTARFWRNSGFILGGIRARRGNSSLGANQARKHSVGHTRMFVSRFVVVSPVAVVMSESPLELAGLFQYHITSNSRNY